MQDPPPIIREGQCEQEQSENRTVALFEQAALSEWRHLRHSVPRIGIAVRNNWEEKTLTRCSPDPFDFAQRSTRTARLRHGLDSDREGPEWCIGIDHFTYLGARVL